MPATSKAQQRLFAIAEHAPSQLYARNKGLAALPVKTLHDFAATKTSKLPTRVKPKTVASPKVKKPKLASPPVRQPFARHPSLRNPYG